MFYYQVEMFYLRDKSDPSKGGNWVLTNRYYRVQKDLTEFDLHDVKDRRKNAQKVPVLKATFSTKP